MFVGRDSEVIKAFHFKFENLFVYGKINGLQLKGRPE